MTGSIVVSIFSIGSFVSDGGRKLARIFLGKVFEKNTARSAALGLGVPGLSLIHWVTKAGWAFIQSSTYVLFVGSALTQAWARALCRSAHWATMCGLPWKLILLKPVFDVRRHGLSGLGTASIFHNRPEGAGDPVAQCVVGGAKVDEAEAEAS